MCEYHTKPFIYYCSDCKCHLCEQCRMNEHMKNGHKIENLKEIHSKINKNNLSKNIYEFNHFISVDFLEYKNKYNQS